MNAPHGGASGPNPTNNSLRPRAVRPTPMRPVTPMREVREVATSLTPRRVGSSPRLGPIETPRSPWIRRLKAFTLVAVAVGSAIGVVKMRDAVEQSARFPLRAVVVEVPVGVDALSDSRINEVRAYAELDPGIPWFGIDTDAVARRVERHPFVREARVERRPPDAIDIVVTMREPFALLRIDEALYLVDEDGEVMKRARPGDPIDLPMISLAEAPLRAPPTFVDSAIVESAEASDGRRSLRGLADAVDILDVAARLGFAERISEVVAIPAAGFEIVLVDGARARIGSTDIETRLRRLLSAEQTLKQKGQAFSFMWLDDGKRPERVAIRLRTATETSPIGG